MEHANHYLGKFALGVFACAGGFPSLAEAQDASARTSTASGAPAQPADEPPEQIVIVGSRRVMRSVLDSPTPVDAIEASEMTNQATTDMDDLLRTLVPSYNVNPQPINNAGTMVRPANLRGLPPDATVVLVNGKRRHRGSVITFTGGGISDGSHGADLAPIPALALKRVEVLRDGAAAQYGSDAIAGVMNFVLRDDPFGAQVVSRVGSTYEGDGTAWSVAGNVGLPLTGAGFLNLTLEYGNSDPTSRSVQRADAAQLAQNGLPVRNPAQVWGAPEISDELKLFANLGLEVAPGVSVYAFGNIARRDILGGFFFRNPTRRAGVYSADGGDTILVGDLTPNDNQGCPVVNIDRDTLVIDPVALQQVIDDPNCFAFNELFPGGFTPSFGGRVMDLSLAGGVRGVTRHGLAWDLSAVVGSNNAQFKLTDTVNASLGPRTPTEFTAGSYEEVDQTYNFDLAYPLDIGIHSPLTVAGGVEYRVETFTVVPGDTASFEIGPLADQGFSIGSNGFPGFSSDIAGSFDRKNIAGYLDLTTDIVEPWTVQVAGRIEHFDTFGTQATAKASTRLALSDLFGFGFGRQVAIRGAVGTGFRAPSAGQVNISDVTTQATPDGILENRATIPPTHPVAVAVGGAEAGELAPETSLNVTAGLVLAFDRYLQLTADFYRISVKDRISQSRDFEVTPGVARDLRNSGYRAAGDFDNFRFFTNAFDTTTRGVDVVATSQFALGDAGTTALSAAYAWNETDVDFFIEGVIDEKRIAELTTQIPRHRFVLAGNHQVGAFRAMARGSYYSSFRDPENNFKSHRGFTYGPRVLVDAEVAYTILDRFTLVAGAQNIFNTFPDENPESAQLKTGRIYPENSAIGINGGFWYFRLHAELW